MNNNKKNRIWVKCIFFCFNLLILSYANSQSVIHIKYYDDTEVNDFKKLIFRDYHLFLVIDSIDYEITRISDTILIGPFLPDSIKNKIIGRPVVKVKFVNDSKCYLSNFENVFTQKEYVLYVNFFYARRGFKIWKGFVVSWPTHKLAIAYSTKVNGRMRSESMEVCK